MSTAHGTESKTISVTQLDKVSNYFYSVSENGSFGRNSSSDYNHKLATWAMELSYAAYNYPNGEELPIIPGAFMGDFTQTAGMLLEDNGFVNISEYNYTSDSRAAHTIGWRPIDVDVSETSQSINDVGGMGNVYQYNIDDKGSVLYNLLDSVCVCDYDQGRNYFRDNTLITGEDTEISTSHDDEIETKPLVVVDVRGSVTLSDWINDVMTQFDSENNRFADEIFTNVENFYSVSENGSFGRNSSSDYNHKLATWAMELSYAAYNYPNGEELPIIPGAFMGDFTQTAGMLLEDNGFVNISEYNYTSDSRAAHTIGWRPIDVDVSETSQSINDVGGMGNVYQYNIDDKGSVLYNLLDSVCVYERNTCRSNSGNPEIMDRNVDVLEVSENSLATTTIKNLVVIDIRGSVTLLDWGNDIVTQFAPNNNRFAALADEVLTNVENYLSSTGLQDPIILVTGHSMGAAIANILAARLNETMDSDDIYAYTFATQLDRVSSCFNNIDSYGNVTAVTASDYNHRLATWAMELSYAAYNYPNGEELPIIPGAFMGDFTQTAGMLLEDNGFVNISEYNYTSDSRAAHTIGWRPIDVDVSETSQSINDVGGMGNVYQYNIDDKGSVLYNLLDSVCVCDYDQGRNYFRDDTVVIEENTALNTSQDDEVGTKPLVVVDVRGSVTISDWINDVMTQFDSENNRFAAFADEIFTNVENYLSSTGVQNPIILVTGHSMGAAIANILAARLNGIMDSDNVYAYTFATPRTVNEAVSGNQAVNYPNIFNILNSNDVVTYVPLTITLPVVNYWKRHGIDLYINMPYSESRETDILGMPCHSMSVYLNWLNSSEDLSLQEMLALSEEARVRGLLPIIAKIKCPVGVTIKDSNGNIIGYESQQENAVYPDMLDNGVMSWIEEDGAKMFFIPSIADAASIEIEAYDYGSMNFTVGSVDASTESEIKTLNNISLYPGKEFTADISEDVPVEDTQLFITENGETVGEVTETNPHLKGTGYRHEVMTDHIITHWSFTTDKTVTEIRVSNKHGRVDYITSNQSRVVIVEDGDNLIWEVFYMHLTSGDLVYDVLIKSDEEWHTYQNSFYVYMPQEYADINLEYYYSKYPKTAAANAEALPAAVPYYTVINPTDN